MHWVLLAPSWYPTQLDLTKSRATFLIHVRGVESAIQSMIARAEPLRAPDIVARGSAFAVLGSGMSRIT
jgi:hypothetical protein